MQNTMTRAYEFLARRCCRKALIAVICSVTSFGHAAAQPADKAIAPEAAGAVAACAVCHGNDGAGNALLDAPRIGGLAAWYTARQLEHFRSGIRGSSDQDKFGHQMHAVALLLDSENVAEELGRYFATLSPPAPATTVSGDVERGEQLYATCAACHGQDGRGSEQLNTPSMVGQHDWYLVRQLQNFKNGARGASQADTFGQQMSAIMNTLPDRQAILDVVAYIETL